MKKNMGTIDRTLRDLIALTVGALYYFGVISGTLAIILAVLAVIFVVTSIFGFCPLYLPFKIHTNKV